MSPILGVPAVLGADEQSDRPVDVARWVRLAEAVLGAEGVTGEVEVSLLFVDEPTIAELHRRFLGRDGPTDVLAFPIDDEPVAGGRFPDAGGRGPGWNPPEAEDLPVLLGDVVICPSVAWRNASGEGSTGAVGTGAVGTGAAGAQAARYEDELALLVVHGLLHLQGMDHEEEGQAQVMERRERELLDLFYRLPGPAGTEASLPLPPPPAARPDPS